ncbi:MAG: tRNA (adenosine(37)-N6)-threonylcarbamoyltransferase complex transferase subunit TsaD [Acidimicrobiales bacterium]
MLDEPRLERTVLERTVLERTVLSGPATVLGIETSCDETAAAVVVAGRDVLSSVVSSQIDLHARFGGVVPELAGRAHVELLTPVVAKALLEAGLDPRPPNPRPPDPRPPNPRPPSPSLPNPSSPNPSSPNPSSDAPRAEESAGSCPAALAAVAATVGPGLIGSLLVGVSAAKAMALVWGVPFVGVNHLEAHLYAASLEDPTVEYPAIVVLVSGGHTMLIEMEGRGRYRLLGQTLDDAAGEAFDKVARFLGLEYPGGPAIDRLATEGDPTAIRFPRAMMDGGWDFSFSGLKTSVIHYVRAHPEASTPDLAASFQRAVVEVLVTKARRAAAERNARAICLAGGVAANTELRSATRAACEADGLQSFLPSRAMCTDNAAMVAAAGWWRLCSDGPSPLDTGADPGLKLDLQH